MHVYMYINPPLVPHPDLHHTAEAPIGKATIRELVLETMNAVDPGVSIVDLYESSAGVRVCVWVWSVCVWGECGGVDAWLT